MSLSKQEKDEIKSRLDRIHNTVHLQCDGYLVSARLGRISKTKLAIIVYVDGRFKGKWLNTTNSPEEGKRFFPLHKKRAITRKDAKLLKMKDDECFYYYRQPCFSTPNVFVNHICKHNDDIRLIDYDEYSRLLAKKVEGNAH
ncbi:MAG: hypothetical protein CR975_05610 [Gammaproteobacteria bacterium]|nr:MAG: hypothetical protein CR975_05610 [Gammaproteobacteria bacterium]